MATKAKGKPALKKKSPPPGKFKARTAGYRFEITDGDYKLVHNLLPMSDVVLLNWQRGVMATDTLSGDVASLATIEVWTQAWLDMVESVEGYEGIEDGVPVTAEAVGLIPFYHINQAISRVLASIGVIESDAQKN